MNDNPMLSRMTRAQAEAFCQVRYYVADPESVAESDLRAAVAELETYILDITREFGPALVVLPCGYETYGHPGPHLLEGPPELGPIHAGAPLATLQQFARDVAEGLISEIEAEVEGASLLRP